MLFLWLRSSIILLEQFLSQQKPSKEHLESELGCEAPWNPGWTTLEDNINLSLLHIMVKFTLDGPFF